ncbi:prolyl aminopeptidase [Streptomyces sp. V3I7]|uniref:prolyl aminopeptidase n=1 Tax=Streptomyces sp. V3I7 TaxID=3042278 RepID=UPI002787AD13|nr:prolyl aminopeptidase [Streptomyces sp. V3I7]MDQ0993887.1 proline iminopeptidase [Streptomyces sp. V3I7]
MRTFYPEIEPYVTGVLPAGDGNELYWEISGNPEGKPVLFLHGGPGAGSRPTYRRLFDPAKYRVVVFDQRNCGRSRPHAVDGDVDLAANTTAYLLDDIELLRTHLGIDKWLVFGGSWGVTLGLAYAETFPHRVSEMIFRGVFTARREELDWIFQDGANHLFPDRWEEFLAPLAPEDRGDTVRAYHQLLNHPDAEVRHRAAAAWGAWEGVLLTLLPSPEVVESFTEPEFAAAIARIENHYFASGAFLEEGQLIRDAGKLADIPCVLIQGRYDAICPAKTAWDLHRALPGSELILVDDAGHAYDEPGILHHTIETTDRFAA